MPNLRSHTRDAAAFIARRNAIRNALKEEAIIGWLRRQGACRLPFRGLHVVHRLAIGCRTGVGMTATFAARGAVVIAAGIAATGCTTPYQARGATGGYVGKQLSPRRFAVEFHGNGETSSDLVSNLYFCRCADITVQQGYDVFVSRKLADDGDVPWASANAMRPENMRDRSGDVDPQDFRVAGGYYAPVFIPGGQITTHHAAGYIQLGRYAEAPNDVTVWDARLVLATLKPIVDGGGRTAPIGLEALARLASVQGRGASKGANGLGPTRSPGVTLDDLRQLLPRP